MGKFTTDVLVLNEGTVWTVHGLDYGMAAQGNSFDEAMLAFSRRCSQQIRLDKDLGIEPFSTIVPAPRAMWDLFKTALRLETRQPVTDETSETPLGYTRETRFQDATKLAHA